MKVTYNLIVCTIVVIMTMTQLTQAITTTFTAASGVASQSSTSLGMYTDPTDTYILNCFGTDLYKFTIATRTNVKFYTGSTTLPHCLGVVIDSTGTYAYVNHGTNIAGITIASPSTNYVDVATGLDLTSGAASVALVGPAIDGTNRIYFWNNQLVGTGTWMGYFQPNGLTSTAVTSIGVGSSGWDFITGFAIDFSAGVQATGCVFTQSNAASNRLGLYMFGGSPTTVSTGDSMFPPAANSYQAVRMYPFTAAPPGSGAWTGLLTNGTHLISFVANGVLDSFYLLSPYASGISSPTSFDYANSYGTIFVIQGSDVLGIIEMSDTYISLDVPYVTRGTGTQSMGLIARSASTGLASKLLFDTVFAISTGGAVNGGTFPSTVIIPAGSSWTNFTYIAPAFESGGGSTFSITYTFDVSTAANSKLQFKSQTDPSSGGNGVAAAFTTIGVFDSGTPGFSSYHVSKLTAANVPSLASASAIASSISGTEYVYYSSGKNIYQLTVSTGLSTLLVTGVLNGNLIDLTVDGSNVYAIDSNAVYSAPLTGGSFTSFFNTTGTFIGTLGGISCGYNQVPPILYVSSGLGIQAIYASGIPQGHVSTNLLSANAISTFSLYNNVGPIGVSPDGSIIVFGAGQGGLPNYSLFATLLTPTVTVFSDIITGTNTKINWLSTGSDSFISLTYDAKSSGDSYAYATLATGEVKAYTVLTVNSLIQLATIGAGIPEQEGYSVTPGPDGTFYLLKRASPMNYIDRVAVRCAYYQPSLLYPDNNSGLAVVNTPVSVQLTLTSIESTIANIFPIATEGPLTGGSMVCGGVTGSFTAPAVTAVQGGSLPPVVIETFTATSIGTAGCQLVGVYGLDSIKYVSTIPGGLTVVAQGVISFVSPPSTFYSGGETVINWHTTSSLVVAVDGGATLTLDCGAGLVSTYSTCLDVSSGSFTVVGGAPNPTGFTCTLTVTGEQAAYYTTVASQTYAAITAAIPIAPQLAVFVDPPTLPSNPVIIHVGDSLKVDLLPPTSPTYTNVPVYVVCTNVLDYFVSTYSTSFTSGSGRVNGTYTVSSSRVGNIMCVHTVGASSDRIANPVPVYITVIPAVPTPPPVVTTLVVTDVTPGGTDGSATSNYQVTINNGITGSTGTLLVGISCSSTGTTGTSVNAAVATPSGSGGVTFDPTTFAATFTGNTASAATFNIHVPIVTDGSGANVNCYFLTLGGTLSSSFRYPTTPASFSFFVGKVKTLAAYPADFPSRPLQAGLGGVDLVNGQVVVTITPPMTTISIDSYLSITPSCLQGQTSVGTYSSLVYTSGIMTNQSWTFLAPSSGGQVVCTYVIAGHDVAHFNPTIAPTIFQINDLRTVQIAGVPITGINTAPSTSTMTFPITATNLAALAPSATVALTLTCTGVSSITVAGSATTVVGTSGSTTGIATWTHNAAQDFATFTLSVAGLPTIGDGQYVSCSWYFSGSQGTTYHSLTSFAFWIGTPAILNAQINGSSTIQVGQTRAIFILDTNTGVAPVINSGLGLTIDGSCVICQDNGRGYTEYSISPSGTFNAAGNLIHNNYFTFHAQSAGQVTCTFTLQYGDLTHFNSVAINNVVFTVTPVTPVPTQQFTITTNNGVTAPIQTNSITFTTTPIPITVGASQSFAVTASAPNALSVSLSLTCTAYGSTITPLATGASSVSGNVAIWTSTSNTAAVWNVVVNNPTAAQGGVNVLCTFGTVGGVDASHILTPTRFSFYIGPTIQLAANYGPTVVYANSESTPVTVTTVSTAPTEGFSLIVQCNIGGSVAPLSYRFGNGFTSSVPLHGFVLYFPSSSSITASFKLTSTVAGNATCSYSVDPSQPTDYLHFLVPTTTTVITFLPQIGWNLGGTGYSATSIVNIQTATATLTVTPSQPLVNTESSTISLSCYYTLGSTGPGNWVRNLDVTPVSVLFNSGASTTQTFTITMPLTGTATLYAGQTVECDFSASSSPSTHFVQSPSSVYIFSGTTGTFTYKKPVGPIYQTSVNGQATDYTYWLVPTPQYCTGEGQLTITATCGGGNILFSNNNNIISDLSVNEAIGFTYYTPTSGALVGTFTCTFTITPSLQKSLAFYDPAPLTIVVAPRNALSFTGLNANQVAGATPTLTISLGMPAPPNGVTVNVVCDSTQGNAITLANSESKFYFFEGTSTQTIVATLANDFIVGSCTATIEDIVSIPTSSDSLSDENVWAYDDSSITITAGRFRTYSISGPTTASATCTANNLLVTLQHLAISSLVITASCNDPLGSITSSYTFTPDTGLTHLFAYQPGRRAVNVVCTFVVDPSSDAADLRSFNTAAVPYAFTIGSPIGFTYTVPTNLNVAPNTVSTFTVQPLLPVESDITVTISVTGGGISSTPSLQWSTSDVTKSQSFTITSPNIAAGLFNNLVITLLLTGSDAPYYNTPPVTTLVSSPLISFALTASGTLQTGQTATLSVTPSSIIALATSVSISCVASGSSTPFLNTAAVVPAGSAAVAFPVATATLPSVAGTATCSASLSGAGAPFVTTVPNLSFTFVQSSSSTGSGSTGSDGGTGGGTGDANIKMSLPSIFLYFALLLIVVLLARQE